MPSKDQTNARLRKKRLRKLLFAATLIPLVLLVAFLGGNALVQSETFRQKIADTIKGSTGIPVTVAKLQLLPNLHLRAGGITIDAHTEIGKPPLVQIGSIEIKPRWSSLFSDSIIIEELNVTKPNLTLLRRTDGKMENPLPKRTIQIAGLQKPGPDTVRPGPLIPELPTPQPGPSSPANGQPTSPAPTENKKLTTKAGPTSRPSPPPAQDGERGILIHQLGKKVGFESFNLDAGNFQILSEPLPVPLLSLEGYQIHMGGLGEAIPTGELYLPSVKLFGIPLLHEGRMDISIPTGSKIELTNLRASLLGGNLSGKADIDLLAPGAPIYAAFLATSLTLPRIVSLTSSILGGVSFDDSSIDVAYTTAGYLEIPSSLRSAINLKIHNIKIKGGARLEQLKENWQVRAFDKAIKIDSLETTINFAQGEARIDDLSVKTEHGICRIRGWVDTTGQLKLKGRLYVTQEVAQFIGSTHQQVPGKPSPTFIPLQHTTWLMRTPDINILGSLDEPVCDLLSPGTMTSISDFVEVLSSPQKQAKTSRENLPVHLAP